MAGRTPPYRSQCQSRGHRLHRCCNLCTAGLAHLPWCPGQCTQSSSNRSPQNSPDRLHTCCTDHRRSRYRSPNRLVDRWCMKSSQRCHPFHLYHSSRRLGSRRLQCSRSCEYLEHLHRLDTDSQSTGTVRHHHRRMFPAGPGRHQCRFDLV